MNRSRIAVTGATGSLGGRVARGLAERGIPLRLIVRNVSRAPDLPNSEVATVSSYLDKPGTIAALQGIETAFFVSGFESEDRLIQHKAVVDAFVEAGVKRVVYTSFLNASPNSTFTFARHHFYTEEYLKAAGLRFVALRNSLYTDILPDFVTDGVIRGPAGDGKFAPVSRDDIADVAVAALLDDEQPIASVDVTGPTLMSMQDVARQLSEIGGKPVTFLNETLEQAYASRARFDASQFEVEGWVTSYYAIAVGELEVVSDTVERIGGHPPRSLREVLER